jgi:hypothetical protein
MIEISGEVNRLQTLSEVSNYLSDALQKGEHSDSIHEKISLYIKTIEHLLSLEEVQNSGQDLTVFQEKIDQANQFINQ